MIQVVHWLILIWKECQLQTLFQELILFQVQKLIQQLQDFLYWYLINVIQFLISVLEFVLIVQVQWWFCELLYSLTAIVGLVTAGVSFESLPSVLSVPTSSVLVAWGCLFVLLLWFSSFYYLLQLLFMILQVLLLDNHSLY